ncbi:MAG: selenocysteine-specific translation elongation factor [Nitrososphaerota archaeon]|nr:selenocysteine-specific translation elongation factor [Candidatus Bathyarchaeota archaeon]MDW8024186.1 selenocysteine-specific translation elongation factor [Nitrososphaerota archaeon]
MTTEKSFLLILCGIPSSGKTELAKRTAKILEKKHNKPVMVVGTDVFREMMSISTEVFKPEREAFLKFLALNTISLGLQNGYIVISDDLNYYTSMRKDLADLAKSKGAGFGVVYVNTPLNVALEWNRKRGSPIPDELIEEVYAKFEEPGKKYRWDSPIITVNPAKDELDVLAERVASETIQCMLKWGKPIKVFPLTPQTSEIEKATRRAMGEIMARFRVANFVDELSYLRKSIVQQAVKMGLSPEAAVKLFFENAERILSQKILEKPHGLIQFHVGLFGHVDHGKTALARCLTEKPSTASLDKHPEAQKRGMTIDMGFSSFKTEGGLVTLVDLPGHYSLIEHAVAGGHIIDLALLVVAADEGPMAQTLEHLKVLESLDVKNLICVITKKDLVIDGELEKVKEKIQGLLKGSKFENSKIVATSSETREGIEDLKKLIGETLKFAVRNWAGPFRMPCDHAFHVKGVGTVVTGTIIRGKVYVGDEVELQPAGKRGKVKSIQTFGESLKEAQAGDRVGIAVSEIRPADVFRGCELSQPGSIKPANYLVVKVRVDKDFKYVVKGASTVHLNVGLQTVAAAFIPYLEDTLDKSSKVKVLLPEVKAGDECFAFLKTNKAVPAEAGDKVLIFKLDLPPKTSRIIGAGTVTEIPSHPPDFVKKKVKRGFAIKKISSTEFIIQGMFKSKDAVEKYVGKALISDSGIKGKIRSPIGTEGLLIAEFEKEIREGDICHLISYKRLRKPI